MVFQEVLQELGMIELLNQQILLCLIAEHHHLSESDEVNQEFQWFMHGGDSILNIVSNSHKVRSAPDLLWQGWF